VTRRPLVAVFGSSAIRPPSPAYDEAEELGRRLALAGADVMTGGYGGAMEACSRGAREAGGHVVGVTVEIFERRGPVNRWVEERVHTPDLFERLRYLIARADGFVAVSGSVGTLSEVLLTWTLLSVNARPRAPLVLLGAPWKGWLEVHHHPGLVPPHLFEHVRLADTPVDAVRLVLDAAPGPRPG
jgi:hypothetical protein